MVNHNQGQCFCLWDCRQIKRFGRFILNIRASRRNIFHHNSATRKQDFQNHSVETVIHVHVKCLILSLFLFFMHIFIYQNILFTKPVSLFRFLSIYCRRGWEKSGHFM